MKGEDKRIKNVPGAKDSGKQGTLARDFHFRDIIRSNEN